MASEAAADLPLLTLDQFLDSPQVIRIIDDKKDPVTGIASLLEQLYVIYNDQSYVKVYHTSKPELQDEIHLDGLECPTGLAACPHNNCIYVCDEEYIYRVHLDNLFVLFTASKPAVPKVWSADPQGSVEGWAGVRGKML